jgi:predicted dehydrogenase
MMESERKLRFGMVGGDLSAFVGKIHRKAALENNDCVLCAGCFSRKQEKNLKTAEAWSVDADRAYVNFEEMAEKESVRSDGIDFVIITTPNVYHYDIVKSFLEGGISVVCDKPFTDTLAQALELKQLAARKNCYICISYTNMGYEAVKKMRKMVKNGVVGNIRMVFTNMLTEFLAPDLDADPSFGGWRMMPELSGPTNCLGDICTHLEHIAKYATGLKIKSLCANLDYYNGRKLDNNAEILIKYDNGASGVYWGSQVAVGQGHHATLQVYGDKGSILWDSWERDNLIVTKIGEQIKKQVCPRNPANNLEEELYIGFKSIYSEFCKAMRAKFKSGIAGEKIYDFPDADDGIDGVVFIEKCLESNFSHCRVFL